MGMEGREDHEEIPPNLLVSIQQIKYSLPFCCLVSSSFVSCSSFFLPVFFFFPSLQIVWPPLLGALCLLVSWSLSLLQPLSPFLSSSAIHAFGPSTSSGNFPLPWVLQTAGSSGGNRHFLSLHLASVILLGSFKWQSPLPYWELYTKIVCFWCLPA